MENGLHNGLKDAQLYTHAPVIGIIILQFIIVYKCWRWKTNNGWKTKSIIIFGILLVISIATVVLSYIYHTDLNDAELDNNGISIAEMVSISTCTLIAIGSSIYAWSNIDNSPFETPIFGFLFGAIGFSVVYAIIMFVCGWIEYDKHDDYLKELAKKAAEEAAKKAAEEETAEEESTEEETTEEETSEEKTGGARVRPLENKGISKWSSHFVNYTLYHIQWHNWSCIVMYLFLAMMYIILKNLANK